MDAGYGSREDAVFIRDWYRSQNNKWDGQRSPEGWKTLGEGCYRAVFLNVVQGVVYKVQHYGGMDSGQSNRREAATIRRLLLTKKFPDGIRMPRFTLHDLGGDDVLVMEKFDRLLRDFSSYTPEGNIYWFLQARLCSITRLGDMHAGNIAVDRATRTIIPIDLGC